MARITAIINQKGGVGKTTTAHALATGLHLRGHSVLVIDADPQGSITGTMQAVKNRPGVYDLLKGATDVIQRVDQGDVISSSANLIGADREFTDLGREYLLREALQKIDGYDHIVIDCPPAIGIITLNALTAATDVIIPVGADIYSLEGVGQLFDTIGKVRRFSNPQLRVAGMLICRKGGRAVLTREFADMISSIANQQNVHLYAQPIREAVAIREAQAMHESIFKSHSKTAVAADYAAFIDEYIAQEGE